MLTPDQWAFIRDLGLGGLLTIALIGGFRGWYVWAWTYRAMLEDRNYWRGIALRGLNHADKAIEIVEKQAPGA